MKFAYNGFSAVFNMEKVTHAELIGNSSGNVNIYVEGVEDPIVAHMGTTDDGVAMAALKRFFNTIDAQDYA